MSQDDVLTIRYRISYDGEAAFEFPVHLDAKTLSYIRPADQKLPAWTRLDVEKCKSCPLSSDTSPHCPTAASLGVLVEHFNALLSYSQVHVSVEMDNRTISTKASVQKVLSSLIGLHMATSGCPHLDFLKPLARFHLPFATREETVFRAVGAFLIGEFFKHHAGEAPDLELQGLHEAYERIHEVNVGMADRLRHFVQGDANVNAIVILDLLAQEMPMAIDSKLKDLAYLYAGGAILRLDLVLSSIIP